MRKSSPFFGKGGLLFLSGLRRDQFFTWPAQPSSRSKGEQLTLDFIWHSLQAAFHLIVSGDTEVYQTVWTSLYVAGVATVIAGLVGIPTGAVIGLYKIPMRRAVITILNTSMALPTVVVGLLVYGFISRKGPLGRFDLLFTPSGIIIGLSVLSIPLVAHYTISTVKGADQRVIPTALTLGASRWQATLKLLKEVRFGIIAAMVAGFGRVIAEVGVAMMLGGNIRGFTRTMTTAIALETSKGEFAFGLALGLVLLTVALLINLIVNSLQYR